MKTIKIEIHFRSNITLNKEKCYGLCQQSGNKFIISIDKEMSLINKFGVIFHELTHAIVLWLLSSKLETSVEEVMCDSMEDTAKTQLTLAIHRRK